jgi:hypothetical protein
MKLDVLVLTIAKSRLFSVSSVQCLCSLEPASKQHRLSGRYKRHTEQSIAEGGVFKSFNSVGRKVVFWFTCAFPET